MQNTEAQTSSSPSSPPVTRDTRGIKTVVQELEEKHKHEPYVYKPCCHYHHPYSCQRVIVKHFLRVLPASFLIYFPVHSVPLLIFKRKQLKTQPVATMLQFSKSICRSVLFLQFFQVLLVVTLCTGNKLFRADHWISAFLSGAVSGLAVLFEKYERRKEMMLYCIPRCVECITNVCQERKLLTKERLNTILTSVFVAGSACCMYFYQHQKKSVKPSVYALMKLFLGGKN